MNYLFVSTVSFSLFIAFYFLLFRQRTFFGINRFYLLFALLFSSLCPLLQVSALVDSVNGGSVYTLPTVYIMPTAQAAEQSINLFHALAFTYWMGIVISFYIVSMSLFKLTKTLSKGEKHGGDEHTYFIENGRHAFSFFHRIHIGKDLQDDARQMILKHEMVHLKRWHTIDVLLFTLGRVFFWFNPLIHMAAKEIQLIHEYEADEQTAKNYGTDYQYTLLNQAFETNTFQLTNTFFNKSIIKNRIVMMNKSKSNNWTKAVYVLALPLVAGGLWLSSCQQAGVPDANNKSATLNEAMKPSEKVYTTDEMEALDEMPNFPGGKEAMMTYYQENFKYPQELKDSGVEGKVFVSFVINEEGKVTDVKAIKGENEILKEAAVTFIQNMPDWKPGMKDGNPVKVEMKQPVNYVLN